MRLRQPFAASAWTRAVHLGGVGEFADIGLGQAPSARRSALGAPFAGALPVARLVARGDLVERFARNPAARSRSVAT
jgi:hypothetical protein